MLGIAAVFPADKDIYNPNAIIPIKIIKTYERGKFKESSPHTLSAQLHCDSALFFLVIADAHMILMHRKDDL